MNAAQRPADAVAGGSGEKLRAVDLETVEQNTKRAAAVTNTDGQIARARKKVFAADYDVADGRHTFSAFREISYRRYVRRGLLGT